MQLIPDGHERDAELVSALDEGSDSPGGGCDIEEPLTLTVEGVSELLGITVRQVRRMYYLHQLPAPLTLGTRELRWSTTEIHDWVASGCPNRNQWARRKR